MNLYFLISGTLAILISFGVLSIVLKANKLDRIILSAFLILSCVVSVMGNISLLGISLSINFLVYFLFFVLLFFQQKSIKAYLATILSALIVIAVMMCYNAINLSNFEFSLIQPYVYVALVIGIVLFYICPNYKSAFCGTFLGFVCFELLFHELSASFVSENLVVGGTQCILMTFVSLISFCLYATFVYFIKAISSRKKEKVETQKLT